ncbi:MAG: AI-2E family transporter [Peptostreptococcus sp.]|uniref:AI-2E family transporter n=1 Tax=Peptostreptococcus sp. TaxID=1262 RepID=UPI002FCC3126
MKIDWNKKYTTIAVYSLIVIFSSIAFYLSVTKFSRLSELTNAFFAILKPFILGFSLAYLFNFVLDFYEEKVIKKFAKRDLKLKQKRALSLVMTYFTVLVVIALFLKFVLPQVADSLSKLLTDFPSIMDQLYTYTNKLVEGLNLSAESKHLFNSRVNEIGKKAVEFATNLMPYLANLFLNVVKSVWNTVLGLIISIYILADKESFFALCKKFISAIFPIKVRNKVLYITRLSNQIFGKFIVGKIIDSCIIAFITFVTLSIAAMPYKILITFIIGITNVIPFFGPFIGAIPSIIIVLLVDPIKALWLALIILIIQQIDGNIIGPKILGDSIGISSFWILFSLLLAGKFFGIIGMVIGVPLFAIIYTIIGESVNNRLQKKGLPISKEKYK